MAKFPQNPIKAPLPDNFKPGPKDVICARGKISLQHPFLSFCGRDVKVRIHFDSAFVPGVEIIAVVVRLESPDEPQRHSHADVTTKLVLEAEEAAVDAVVALEDVIVE